MTMSRNLGLTSLGQDQTTPNASTDRGHLHQKVEMLGKRKERETETDIKRVTEIETDTETETGIETGTTTEIDTGTETEIESGTDRDIGIKIKIETETRIGTVNEKDTEAEKMTEIG